MRLTPQQVQRLSGLDNSLCRLVLDDLVRAHFLRMGLDGNYARCADGEPSRNAHGEGRSDREHGVDNFTPRELISRALDRMSEFTHVSGHLCVSD